MIYDVSKDVFAAATPGFQPLPSDVARLSGFLSTSLLSLFLHPNSAGNTVQPGGSKESNDVGQDSQRRDMFFLDHLQLHILHG